MEELTALFCLWVSGLRTKFDYTEKLDELFLNDPENDFLLELEGLCGDPERTLTRLAPLINEENADIFGKVLIAGVERYYTENVLGKAEALEPFTRLTYKLWRFLLDELPFDFAHSDPIMIFCYADEPLEWGDEKQTVELLQKAFDYYKEKS